MLSLVGAIGLASCGAAFTSGDEGVDGASGAAGASSGSGGSVDPGNDASNAGGGATAGPGGMAGSGVTAGSAGTAGSRGGASNGADAFVEADTRPPLDASSPPESGAGDGSTVTGDAGRDGIFCGSMKCNPVSQVCCAEAGALDPLSTLPLRCVPKGMCSGTSPMNIPCDDHADCAASSPTLPVCCVGTSYGMPNGHFILDECTIPSGCVSNANVRHAYVCSGPDDTTSCPAGTACKPGQLREGYFTCQ